MNSILIFLVAGLFGGFASSSADSSRSSPVVDLVYSRYRGISLHNGVDEYLGMRYAKAPVDELRFRKPYDPEFTDDVIDATSVRSYPQLTDLRANSASLVHLVLV